MSKVNGRQKGKRGELELAHWLASLGYPSRRGQQYSGTADSADVVTALDNLLYMDSKRVENLQLQPALDQVIRDAGDSGRLPVVMHRKNRGRWIAIMDAEAFIELLREHPRIAPRTWPDGVDALPDNA